MTEPRRFVILDRDGTLNVERHYLSDPDQVELYPRVGGALRRLRELDLGLVVVTNQSGVARGYFDIEAVYQVHARIRKLLIADGAVLEGFYICPHGPDARCTCRKPLPGLVEQAVADHHFVPAQAFVVGDKAVDVNLARAIGAKAILVRTGWGAKSEHEHDCDPDVIVDDLTAAAAWIERSIAGGEG